MKKILVLLAVVAIAVVVAKPKHGMTFTDDPDDTLQLRFVPLKLQDANKLSAEMLKRFNESALEGERYYEAKMMSLPDSIGLKILNIYGDVSGGATYNPFAVSYIIRGNSITDSVIGGEIFRIDQLKNGKLLVYVDDYWRLGSNFKFYEASFRGDSLTCVKSTAKSNFLINCMSRKMHNADSLPRPRSSSDESLLEYLGLEKVRRGSNSYYWYDDEHFLSRISSDENDYFEPVVYFRNTKGDITEKVLRIGQGENAREWVLAMRADDPYERMSSEFINDSIYRTYYKSMETVEDLQDLMADEIDSAVTDYKYDRQLNFAKIGEKRFHYRTEHFTKDNQRVDRRITFGEPFSLNALSVQEKFIFEKRKGELPVLYTVLIDAKTKTEILRTSKTLYLSQNEYTDSVTSDLVDVNLDGYLDFKRYDYAASGSAGSWDDVYIFNPKLKKFEKSDLFSGYDVEIDKENRIVTSYGRSGGFNFRIEKIHLDKKSRVKFTEGFSCSYNNEILTLVYSKHKKGKKISEKTKSFPAAERNQEEVREMLLNMASD